MSDAMAPYELARFMHDTYERLAPEFGYVTRPESAVPWRNVPIANKRLMINVASEVIEYLEGKNETTAKN